MKSIKKKDIFTIKKKIFKTRAGIAQDIHKNFQNQLQNTKKYDKIAMLKRSIAILSIST